MLCIMSSIAIPVSISRETAIHGYNRASRHNMSTITYSDASFAPISALASSSGSLFARFLLAANFFSTTGSGAEPEALRLRAERRGSCAGASDMFDGLIDAMTSRMRDWIVTLNTIKVYGIGRGD